MDWDKAIERNEMALLRIVSAIFALLLDARLSGSGLMIPRRVWRAILIVLRPAEAAVRRLIIIAARALSCAAPALRQRSDTIARAPLERPANTVVITPVFQLFDPLKAFEYGLGDAEEWSDGMATSAADDLDDTPINAESLHNRLRALRHALADLPKQAARLARFNARRDAACSRPVNQSAFLRSVPACRPAGTNAASMMLIRCCASVTGWCSISTTRPERESSQIFNMKPRRDAVPGTNMHGQISLKKPDRQRAATPCLRSCLCANQILG